MPTSKRARERRDLDHERRTFVQQVVNRVLDAAREHHMATRPNLRFHAMRLGGRSRAAIDEEASGFFSANRFAIDDARDLAGLPTAGGFRPTAAADAYFDRRYDLLPVAFGDDAAARALRAAADRQGALSFGAVPSKHPGDLDLVPAHEAGGDLYVAEDVRRGEFTVRGGASGAALWRGPDLASALRAEERLRAGRKPNGHPTKPYPKVGQIVEFDPQYPWSKCSLVRGEVIDVGSLDFPGNPSVMTRLGRFQLLARDWGTRVRVVEDEDADY